MFGELEKEAVKKCKACSASYPESDMELDELGNHICPYCIGMSRALADFIRGRVDWSGALNQVNAEYRYHGAVLFAKLYEKSRPAIEVTRATVLQMRFDLGDIKPSRLKVEAPKKACYDCGLTLEGEPETGDDGYYRCPECLAKRQAA